MTAHKGKVGIIAGGGRLPVLVAESCESSRRPYYIVGLEGHAEAKALAPYPHGWSGLGTVDRLIGLLKEQDCTHVVLAGMVTRPDFRSMKLDWRGSRLLPKIVKRL